eukprot:TRINITY_DN22930_c0_g1_i1.p1 TRINITY_DN22930_c0_g1~~TRINITY_DN22930_c0_g1_i1.p1  ORF type:complete len:367 (-),score=63.54 TRINITY_DN22930_c0_g1_i1:16-1053(-)
MALHTSWLLSCIAVAALLAWRGRALEGFAVASPPRDGASRSLTCVPRGPCLAAQVPRNGLDMAVVGSLASAAFAVSVCTAFRKRSRASFAGTTSEEQFPSSRPIVACRADPLMPWRIPNTQQYQWLSVRELLLRERILMVTEYIDDTMANAYLAMLLYLQSEDAKKPVQIYFSSPGAALQPALALYDTICQLKAKGCKVTTVSYSLCAGMGAFLAASGSPGRRFATPNSLFQLSKTGLESPFQGQATEIELEVRQMVRASDRVEQELSGITGRSREQIQKDLGRNFYLTAAEAVEYGLIDKVLVPDYGKGSKLDQGTRDPWSGQVVKPKVGFGEFADPDQPRTAV